MTLEWLSTADTQQTVPHHEILVVHVHLHAASYCMGGPAGAVAEDPYGANFS